MADAILEQFPRAQYLDGCPGCLVRGQAPRSIVTEKGDYLPSAVAAYHCELCHTYWQTSWLVDD